MTIKVVTYYNPFSDSVTFGEANKVRIYNNGIFNYVDRVYIHDGSLFKMSYPDFPKISIDPYYSSGATYFSGVYKAYVGLPVTVSSAWTAGENYGYTNTTYDYQWQKYTYIAGPGIYYWANLSGNGATTDTYTPQEEATIRCAVTATNQRGSTTVYSPSLITQIQAATAPTSVTASNNGSQTTVTVSWSGAANAGRYRIYWNSNGVVPGSATDYWDEEKIVDGSTITSTSGSWAWGPSDPDKNGYVPAGRNPQYFMVSASSDGTTWTPYVVTSTATGVVVPVPVNTSQPTLTGTVSVGGTITAKSGAWSNSPTSYTVYIYRGTQFVATSETLVASATVYAETTAVNYTITQADYDSGQRYFRAFAIATNAGGSSAVTAGQELGPIPAPTVAPSGGSVTVTPSSGTAGSTTYTASASGWSGTAPISYSYSWQYFSSSSFSWVQYTTGTTFSPASNINTLYPNYGWKCVVTASNGTLPNATAETSFTVNNPVAAPTNTSQPTLSGGLAVGSSFTFGVGSWSGSPTSYDLRLYRGTQFVSSGETLAKNAGNTTSSTYTITQADYDSGQRYFRTYASATNSGGSSGLTAGQELGPITASSGGGGGGSAPVLSSISGNNSLALGGTFSWSYTNNPTAYSIFCQGPTGSVFTTNNQYTYTGTTFRPGYDGSGWQGAGYYTIYVSARNSSGDSVVSSQTTYMT